AQTKPRWGRHGGHVRGRKRDSQRARGVFTAQSTDVERPRHTQSSRTLWPPQKQLCWQTPLALFSSRRGCNGTCVTAELRCKGCARGDGRPTVKRTTLQCKCHLCQPQHICPLKDHELSQRLQMEHNLAKDNFGNMQCPCHLPDALGQSEAVIVGLPFCDSITQIRDNKTV
ncbi:unnamed protein product, partial [Ixodes pacificus]